MLDRGLRGLPAAPERLAPADEAVARGDAHQQAIERGARHSAERRLRRPVIVGNAQRDRVDALDRDSSPSAFVPRRQSTALHLAGSGARPDRFRDRSRVRRRGRPLRRPHPRQQPGARRPIGLIVGEPRIVRQRVERRKARGGALRFGDRDRAVDRHHRRAGEREQRVVELLDRRPVGAAGAAGAPHGPTAPPPPADSGRSTPMRAGARAAALRPPRSGARPTRRCPARRAARSRRRARAAPRAAPRRYSISASRPSASGSSGSSEATSRPSQIASSARLRRRASVPAGSDQPSAKAA